LEVQWMGVRDKWAAALRKVRISLVLLLL